MGKYRILAMDGGNGLNTALLLQGIKSFLDEKDQDYLENVDLYAGTSAGAINSLFFAKHERLEDAMTDIFKYQLEIYNDILHAEDPWNLVGAATGFNPLARMDKVRAFYVDYFGPTLRLADLYHKVVVVTYVLDNEQPPPYRQWEPRIFTNLPGSPNADALVADVLMRSSALPIAYPLFQSITGEGPAYVDGAVVANNPAMFALTSAYDHVDLKDVLLLSVGTGRNVVGNADFIAPEFDKGVADWGYRQWLMNPADPMLLIDMLIQAGEEAVSFECEQILRERHCRLNVDLKKKRVDLDDEAIREQVEAAVDWLKGSGWLDA